MSTSDPQLERIRIILGAPRPMAEPDEAEILQIADHLGAWQEPTTETPEGVR